MWTWMNWAGVGTPCSLVMVKGMKSSPTLWTNPSGGSTGATARAAAVRV